MVAEVLGTCGQTVNSLKPGHNYNKFFNEGSLFRKAHRGTLLGFMLMSGMFISVVLFFFSAEAEDYSQSQTIYVVTDIAIHVCMLVGTVLALFQISKLSYASKDISIDDFLLLLSMAGSFFLEMSMTISTSSHIVQHELQTETKEELYIVILSLISSLLAGSHTILQLILIIAGLRMYCATRKNLKEMPGRGAITFLLIGNITLWIFRSMQVKRLEMGTQEEFYGTLAWLFIMNLNLPLQLFFFFHSSICLADIFSMAYKPIQPHYHHISQEPSMLPSMKSMDSCDFENVFSESKL